MAIYHLSIKIISRGKGKSAVAASAYRSGEKITNAYDGITHDYTRKGGIVHTEILLPEHAPKEYANRSILWNAVEEIEKSKNSQLSREIEIALPKELPLEQQKSLVQEYCQKHFVSVGMCADICIHDKNDGNPHAHIMLTMRPFEPTGEWGVKSKKKYLLDENGERIKLKNGNFKTAKINTVDWNEQTKAEEWRSGWSDIANQYLEKNNVAEKINHRSYERQGVDQIPTIHMGVSATQMERKGRRTDRGRMNRTINFNNRTIRQLKARINTLKKWLDNETRDKEPMAQNIQETVFHAFNQYESNSRYKRIANLQSFAQAFNFLRNNNIITMEDLTSKVRGIRGNFHSVTDDLKAKEKRIKVLKEHLKHSENYLKHKSIYDKYKATPPKKQAQFHYDNYSALALFFNAQKYLDDIMNGKTKLPIKQWKKEFSELTKEKDLLYQKYYALKDDVRSVEIIKRNIEMIVGGDTPKRRISRDMER